MQLIYLERIHQVENYLFSYSFRIASMFNKSNSWSLVVQIFHTNSIKRSGPNATCYHLSWESKTCVFICEMGIFKVKYLGCFWTDFHKINCIVSIRTYKTPKVTIDNSVECVLVDLTILSGLTLLLFINVRVWRVHPFMSAWR